MIELLANVERTALSVWVRESPSLLAFPFILFLHTLGLAMLAGLNVGIPFFLWLGIRQFRKIQFEITFHLLTPPFQVRLVVRKIGKHERKRIITRWPQPLRPLPSWK